MSMNNILLTATNEPTHRYAKTVPSKLSGIRLDPVKGTEIPFILQTRKPGEFVYDDEVLELYSDGENRHFLQRNRVFIKAGFLREYFSAADDEDLSNIVSDEEVQRIASIRTIPAVKKALGELSSVVTLDRVLTMAKHIGRPASVITLIEQRIQEL